MYELYKMVKNSLKQLKFISKTKTIYKHRTYLTKKQLQDIHNDYHNGLKKKELQKKYSMYTYISGCLLTLCLQKRMPSRPSLTNHSWE